MSDWITLLYAQNSHNIVSQLYFNKKIKLNFKKTPESSFAPSTMWRYGKKLAICTLEEGSDQNLTVLASWPLTSNLQNCDEVSVVYKPPSLWCLVTAVWTG